MKIRKSNHIRKYKGLEMKPTLRNYRVTFDVRDNDKLTRHYVIVYAKSPEDAVEQIANGTVSIIDEFGHEIDRKVMIISEECY